MTNPILCKTKVILRTLTVCCLMFISCFCQGQINKKSHYAVKASINVKQQTFNVEANISYVPKPNDSLNTLTFMIHENADIESCKVKGLVKYEVKKGDNKISSLILYFKENIKEEIQVNLKYSSVLKKDDAPWGIDKISDEWIELSLNSVWLPIVATFDNQFDAQLDIKIIADTDFNVLSSGLSKKVGHNTYKIKNVTPQIDLVLIGSPNFYKSNGKNITIYDHKLNEERNKLMFDYGERSYTWLNNSFGKAKKIPPAKLVITPRKESGYARKNFIVLSNDISVNNTIHFANYIAHEFAHFWSSGANPLTAHRWLDESIAEYIAWKYVQKEFGDNALDEFLTRVKKEAPTLPPVYTKEAAKVPSHAVMYRKGVGKLFELEEMIGESTMFTLMTEWFKEDVKDSEKFLQLIKDVIGVETAQKFRTKLSK
ncbi:hypothetical protein [Aquimarina sp. 2201CG5-10]|uniref:hypothetical protein n=1 Tax=Aquimarina callyspongiae TaxID=3098150 RepID=UPI002AB447C6|nr:hypothetical protein [Aquimarina sp. 2201CG5-10]MDY8137684.1 hypothetical protein [Aquimarina sp. 2201CG5-10]